jgi:hypothetical protein
MVSEGVGRLPVVSKDDPTRVVGMLSRSDLLSAHGRRLDEKRRQRPDFELRIVRHVFPAVARRARGADSR